MDDDERDLVNHLFARATALLEDALGPAAAGQAPNATPDELARHARQMGQAASDAVTLADAITVLLNQREDDTADNAKHPPN